MQIGPAEIKWSLCTRAINTADLAGGAAWAGRGKRLGLEGPAHCRSAPLSPALYLLVPDCLSGRLPRSRQTSVMCTRRALSTTVRK